MASRSNTDVRRRLHIVRPPYSFLRLFASLCETKLAATLLAFATVTASYADEFPTDLVSFDRQGTVIALGERPNQWDAAIRERGSVVRLSDGTLRLYYTGYDGTREGLKRVGLLVSKDDGQTWKRAQHTPVTPDDVWTEDPFVLRHDRKWHMFAEGRGDQAHRLTSDDGLTWTEVGTLDVRLTSGEPIPPGPFGTPTVFVEDGLWHLFYERRDAGIWLATSRDLKVWTNVSDDPVMTPGPEGFDAAMIAWNQVVARDGRYYAYYHGADRYEKPRAWACGVAVSNDLRTWTKYSGNPITDPADNVSSGSLVFVDGRDHAPLLITTHAAIRIHAAASGPSTDD